MDRQQAEDYIYASYMRAERFQRYEGRDAQKRRPDLTKPIIDSLNHTPCVSVTGSKGKGSVANMISMILRTRHRVGLMTSPHIERFNERFLVDGEPISDADFVDAVTALKEPFDRIEASLPDDVCISPMGIQAAVGLQYFNSRNTTYNVFELGKGARYDDVNNIGNTYSVVNTVFLEHTRELGDTLEAIAEDKSWIIKEGQAGVFIGEQQPEVLRILEEAAERKGVPARVYGRDFRAEDIRFTREGMVFDVVIGDDFFADVCVPLLGEHQAKNCALAMAVGLAVLGRWDIDSVRQNLARLEWPGRMEILSRSPFILLDACINQGSVDNVKKVLKHLGMEKCVFIVGIPDDKDYEGVVTALRDISVATILTKSQNPHYRFTDIQGSTLRAKGIPTLPSGSVPEALALAKGYAAPIVILGTTSLIADVEKLRPILF